jgi:hypothetical protein
MRGERKNPIFYLFTKSGGYFIQMTDLKITNSPKIDILVPGTFTLVLAPCALKT